MMKVSDKMHLSREFQSKSNSKDQSATQIYEPRHYDLESVFSQPKHNYNSEIVNQEIQDLKFRITELENKMDNEREETGITVEQIKDGYAAFL